MDLSDLLFEARYFLLIYEEKSETNTESSRAPRGVTVQSLMIVERLSVIRVGIMVELCCCGFSFRSSVSALRAKMHTLVASNRFIVAHNPSTHASSHGGRRTAGSDE